MPSRLNLNKIFLLLILFMKIVSYLEEVIILGELGDNNFSKYNVTKNYEQQLNFMEKNESLYISILNVKNDAKINIVNTKNSSLIEKDFQKGNRLVLLNIKEQSLSSENEEGYITFNVSDDIKIEVTSVRQDKNTKYKKIDYQLDQEIKVKDYNNFVIFLDDEDVEKFEMKFSFKDDIKSEEICYGFIKLPFDKTEYIPIGKNYKELKCEKVGESSKQLTVDNPFYEKSKDDLKPYIAFIFSINKSDELIQEFSFTINSEIINVFLIVSIVIALIFAVITFFLIRRKQTSESGSIEGEDSYNKEEDKEEKDDKEEATEN